MKLVAAAALVCAALVVSTGTKSQTAAQLQRSATPQGLTGLPFGLDYSMTEEQVRNHLGGISQYEVSFKPAGIAYILPDTATKTNNGLFLYFEGGRLTEIVSTKLDMDAAMRQKYLDLLFRLAADWVTHGVEKLWEDPKSSAFAYRDQRANILIMSSKDTAGKFSVSVSFKDRRRNP